MPVEAVDQSGHKLKVGDRVSAIGEFETGIITDIGFSASDSTYVADVEYSSGEVYSIVCDDLQWRASPVDGTPNPSPATQPKPEAGKPNPVSAKSSEATSRAIKSNRHRNTHGFAAGDFVIYNKVVYYVVEVAQKRTTLASKDGKKFMAQISGCVRTYDSFEFDGAIGIGSIITFTSGAQGYHRDRLWCVIERNGDSINCVPVNFDPDYKWAHYKASVSSANVVNVRPVL